MIEEKYKEEIVKFLTPLFLKAKIYLFGSQARGDATQVSDIDLAIDDCRRLSSLELAKTKNILEAINILYSVDVVDFTTLPDNLKKTILEEGILWKS